MTVIEDQAKVRISGHNNVVKRLGNWTTAREFEVRANRGVVVLDLRSPQIPEGDIHIDVDLDHGVLKLLVDEAAVIEDWDLRRVGRGKVKDGEGKATNTGRRIVLAGQTVGAEVRVNRGGIAMLSAMFSREYLADLRRVHREGGFPTVDDPTRTA